MAWSAELKQQAIAVAAVDGVAAAHRATGIPKPTITRWCKDAGVSIAEVVQVKTAQAVVRADTVLRQAARIEEVLEEIRSAAGLYLEAVTLANRDYALAVLEAGDGEFSERLNPITGMTEAEPTTERGRATLSRVRALRHGIEIPHAVGALTRATHDLQLLAGKATENQAVQVVFSAGLAGPSAAEVAALDEGAVIVEGEVLE